MDENLEVLVLKKENTKIIFKEFIDDECIAISLIENAVSIKKEVLEYGKNYACELFEFIKFCIINDFEVDEISHDYINHLVLLYKSNIA